jgi:tight adherence protein C
MKTVVLFGMITIFFVFVALLSPVGYQLDAKKRRLASVFPSGSTYVNKELHQPLLKRIVKPLKKRLKSTSARAKSFGKKDTRANEKLAKQLKKAGITRSASEYALIKGLLQLGVIGGAAFLALKFGPTLQLKILLLLVGIIIAVLIPRYYIKGKIKKRQNELLHTLPDVLDLMVVSVEAGLGFDAAIVRLYEKNKGPLMSELMTVVNDVQMGLPRRNALKDMGERNDVPELKVFASSLVQAEQMGVPIKNVLASQAEQLRMARKQKTEAKAMKAPVKMMIPTVVFIFPVMFIILLAPAVLKFLVST